MTSRVRPAATPHHAATLNPALEVGKAAENSTTLNRSHNRAFPGERSAENKRKLICVKDAQIKVRHSLQVMYIMELCTRDAFWGAAFLQGCTPEPRVTRTVGPLPLLDCSVQLT